MRLNLNLNLNQMRVIYIVDGARIALYCSVQIVPGSYYLTPRQGCIEGHGLRRAFEPKVFVRQAVMVTQRPYSGPICGGAGSARGRVMGLKCQVAQRNSGAPVAKTT